MAAPIDFSNPIQVTILLILGWLFWEVRIKYWHFGESNVIEAEPTQPQYLDYGGGIMIKGKRKPLARRLNPDGSLDYFIKQWSEDEQTEIQFWQSEEHATNDEAHLGKEGRIWKLKDMGAGVIDKLRVKDAQIAALKLENADKHGVFHDVLLRQSETFDKATKPFRPKFMPLTKGQTTAPMGEGTGGE